MSFDSDVDLLSDFTDDRGQINRAIHKARINTPSGGSIASNPGPIGSRQITGTALYDAIYLACNEKLNTEAGRKAVLIVTDAQTKAARCAWKKPWKRRSVPIRWYTFCWWPTRTLAAATAEWRTNLPKRLEDAPSWSTRRSTWRKR